MHMVEETVAHAEEIACFVSLTRTNFLQTRPKQTNDPVSDEKIRFKTNKTTLVQTNSKKQMFFNKETFWCKTAEVTLFLGKCWRAHIRLFSGVSKGGLKG